MFEYRLSDDTWGKEELEAIQEVIRSNRYTMGPKTAEFEEQFAAFFGAKYAVMVNSGSSANLIAIAALIYSEKLKAGDEVIVPAVSWSTTYYPLQQYGLKLKFVDIDVDTLNLDLKQVEEALTEKTKAVFAVNLLGNPIDYDYLQEICDRRNLILIEDNCESLGAKFKGKYTGTFGLLGTFSTFYSHHICTMEGGVIVTDDKNLFHLMKSLRAHGWTREMPHNSPLYSKKENDFYEQFNFIFPGYNVRPLEMEAAIGIKQIDKIETIIKNRRENASKFISEIGAVNGIKLQKEVGESSWFGFSMVLEGELEGRRDELIKLLTENGIENRPIVAGNFTKNHVIKYFDYEVHNELTNADYIHENGFFVGNHSKRQFESIKLIKKVLMNEF